MVNVKSELSLSQKLILELREGRKKVSKQIYRQIDRYLKRQIDRLKVDTEMENRQTDRHIDKM